MPRAAISIKRSPICSTIMGASPSVGSSTMMTCGSPISVRHMVSICFSPPDRTEASTSARLRRLSNMSNMSSTDQRPPFWPGLMPRSRFWRTVRPGKMSRFSGT